MPIDFVLRGTAREIADALLARLEAQGVILRAEYRESQEEKIASAVLSALDLTGKDVPSPSRVVEMLKERFTPRVCYKLSVPGCPRESFRAPFGASDEELEAAARKRGFLGYHIVTRQDGSTFTFTVS